MGCGSSNDSPKEVTHSNEKKDSKTKRNRKASFWLELDKFETMASIRDCLGSNCFSDQTNVTIVLIGRDLQSGISLNMIHPAWLFIFSGHPTYEYATLEYGEQGILLGIYEKNLNLSRYEVCTTIIGASNTILAYEGYSTSKSWGDILERIYKISSCYCGKKFNKISQNCAHFGREFGDYLLGKSIGYRYPWFDPDIKKYQ